MRIRMNSVVFSPDTTSSKTVMFKNNQELEVLGTGYRQEDCGCSGSEKITRMYYIVECLGLQFHIDSDFAREVDDNDPPEETAGLPSDMGNIKVPGVGLEGNKEVRDDDGNMARFRVIFDLRRP